MFDNLPFYLDKLLEGLILTVEATIGGILLATVMALVSGLAMLSRFRAVRVIARIYVEIWRGTSEVVQLLWVFFVLPVLVGYEIVPLMVGIIVLGLNFGAYGGEIVRGAVQSVPKAQHEGCVALSLTVPQRMRRVILPQALVEMVPPMNNLFIQLLKGSALLTLITMHEITGIARDVLIDQNIDDAALIWTLALLFYLVLAILITMGMRWIERRAARMVGRTPPPRKSFFAMFGGSKEANLASTQIRTKAGI